MVHGWTNLYASVDDIFLVIVAVSLVLLIGVTAAMVWFAVRYNRKRHPRAENIEGNLTLEIVWTVIPTLLVLAIFWVGWKGFVYQRTVPADAMLVKVTARMWSWQFAYENGRTDSVLRLPAGRAVKLSITSADVLHSLFIPAFRVKEDCVPAMETYLWFRPEQEGSYDLFCSEYCGAAHSSMITTVEVLPEAEFQAWYRGGEARAAAVKGPDGAALFQEKGCGACHSTDGSPRIGPTLKGIAGRSVMVMTGGKERTVVSDDAYLRSSLLEPQADVVKGFPPIMPSQKGQMTDREIAALVEYLKTLK